MLGQFVVAESIHIGAEDTRQSDEEGWYLKPRHGNCNCNCGVRSRGSWREISTLHCSLDSFKLNSIFSWHLGTRATV